MSNPDNEQKGTEKEVDTKKIQVVKGGPQKKTVTFSSGNNIILGFTGSLGSGCSFVAKGIHDELNKSYHCQLSDILTNSLKDAGVENPTTTQKQDEGNKLREEFGNSILVELCLQEINNEYSNKKIDKDTIIIIDGIRNEGEVRCLRAFPNFYLLSIHAEESVRKQRLVGPSASRQLFENDAEFEAADKRDQAEEIEYGQQVLRCNYLADIIINSRP